MTSTHPINLDQGRSVADIVGATMRLYGYYPWLFFILAAGVWVPWDLVRLAITGIGSLGHVGTHNLLGVESLEVLGLLLIAPLVSAMHVHAVVVIGEGQRPRLSAVAWTGVRVLPIVAAAEFVVSVAIGIGFLFLLVPGVMLWIRWSVVAQAAAIEHEGVRSAWRRSSELSLGHGRHVFGLLCIFWLLQVGIAICARTLTTGAASGVGDVALGMLLDTAFASFSALAGALLYFDLVARQAPALLATAVATA